MVKTRKSYSPKVKFQAVMQLLKGDKSAAEVAPGLGSPSY